MKTIPHRRGPLAALQNALERVAVIVAELEIDEASVAYQVAADLELDLEAAVARLRSTPLELAEAA